MIASEGKSSSGTLQLRILESGCPAAPPRMGGAQILISFCGGFTTTYEIALLNARNVSQSSVGISAILGHRCHEYSNPESWKAPVPSRSLHSHSRSSRSMRGMLSGWSGGRGPSIIPLIASSILYWRATSLLTRPSRRRHTL